MSFSITHVAMLLKYTGISFIAGSVTHGVFSEQRSLVTAVLGVVIYLLSSYVEARATPHAPRKWMGIIAFGVIASIGLGFFTGGLQHFPDSPDRSAWVVPVGFVMSLLAAHWLDAGFGISPSKDRLRYGFLGLMATMALSAAAWFYFHGTPHHEEHDKSPIADVVPVPHTQPSAPVLLPVHPHKH